MTRTLWIVGIAGLFLVLLVVVIKLVGPTPQAQLYMLAKDEVVENYHPSFRRVNNPERIGDNSCRKCEFRTYVAKIPSIEGRERFLRITTVMHPNSPPYGFQLFRIRSTWCAGVEEEFSAKQQLKDLQAILAAPINREVEQPTPSDCPVMLFGKR